MITTADIDAVEARVLAALRSRLRVRAKTLPAGMKRAGRLLPREAHRAASRLAIARRDAGNPRLAVIMDNGILSSAEDAIMRHLTKFDPKERRKDAWLSFAGAQAINLIGIVALVVGLLMWRGFL